MKRKRTSKSIYMKRKKKSTLLKHNKKMLYASSLVLSLFAASMTSSTILALEWTPRTVEEIRPEIVQENGQSTYTIKYGDTLSVIAAAMDIDMEILAKMNQIADVNLIFPSTVLTTTKDQNNHVTHIEIETPSQQNPTETVQASIDVVANEARVDNAIVNLDEVSSVQSASEAQATAETQAAAEAQAAA
ncbi:TPA: LysM peptidoglycan-binding domain-containing protein, partial [Streptococcus suis]